MVTSLFALMAYLSLVFSTGRLPSGSGAWSRLARLGGPLWRSPSSSPPPDPPATDLIPDIVAEGGGFAVALVVLVGAVFSLVVRFLRSVGEERAQLS